VTNAAGHPAEGLVDAFVELPDGRARLSRAHHGDIVRSLYEGNPAELYPMVSGRPRTTGDVTL
jgi:hypothetical protein